MGTLSLSNSATTLRLAHNGGTSSLGLVVGQGPAGPPGPGASQADLTAALAADPTPANAAAAAVTAAVTAQKLVKQTDAGAPVAAALLNDDGTWQEVALDQSGRLVDGLQTSGLRVIPQLQATLQADLVGVVHYTANILGGYAWVDTDSVGRIMRAGFPDGTTVDYTKPGTSTAGTGRGIVAWGDSLSAWDISYPVWLRNVLAARGYTNTVYQRGVGGETSSGIAARSGALPYLMLPAGGAIPASGGVTVTFTVAGGGTTWPLLRGDAFPIAMTGTIAGVRGTLTKTPSTPWNQSDVHQASDVYTFTRTTPGTAVPITRPRAFVLDDATARKGDIPIIWSGRNNTADGPRVLSDIKAMIRNRAPQDDKYLVIGVTNGASEGTGTSAYTQITGVNASLLAEYGYRFLDIRRYLIDYGLADLGITPTTQDTADVAADTIPASLRVDAIHFTSDVHRLIIAPLVANRLEEIGALP